jgi:hypothetical protein
MGSDPVTVVANSVHRHDQSIDLGIYDSDTALQETPIYGIVIIFMELSKATTTITFPLKCGIVSSVTN